VRVTTVVRKVLGVTGLVVDSVRFEPEGLVVAVRPRWRQPRCGACGKRAAGYDVRPARRWRHVGIGELKIWLEYAPRRVDCRRCGAVRTETFPRNAENIAALLYPALGSPSHLDEVREALRRIVSEKECGLIEDPQSGGYVFLSEGVSRSGTSGTPTGRPRGSARGCAARSCGPSSSRSPPLASKA
jgi:hypothetical protein